MRGKVDIFLFPILHWAYPIAHWLRGPVMLLNYDWEAFCSWIMIQYIYLGWPMATSHSILCLCPMTFTFTLPNVITFTFTPFTWIIMFIYIYLYVCSCMWPDYLILYPICPPSSLMSSLFCQFPTECTFCNLTSNVKKILHSSISFCQKQSWRQN